LDEEAFLVSDKFWDAKGSWKEFLKGKKLKWSTVDCFINFFFYNEELKHLHLCLHAPKLDIKGAIQFMGA